MSLTRNLRTKAHDPQPHRCTPAQLAHLDQNDALKSLREKVAGLCETPEEYASLEADAAAKYAVANPGPLAKIMTWAFEMMYWQNQFEILTLRAEQEAAEIDIRATYGLI